MIQGGIELFTGLGLHHRVIQEAVLGAQRYVWIAAANLKDMHVPVSRGFRPILEIFGAMAEEGVTFRIVHSDLPSRLFRKTLERFPGLTAGALELQICSRSHWKMVIIDGLSVYLGRQTSPEPDWAQRVETSVISSWEFSPLTRSGFIDFRGFLTRSGWGCTVSAVPCGSNVPILSRRVSWWRRGSPLQLSCMQRSHLDM